MAKFRPFYIPSRSEGKTWRVYYHKTKGYPAYVAAVEGELNDGFFTTLLSRDRLITVSLSGRSTFKAVTEAGMELLRRMADNSYILADAVTEYTPKLAHS